MNDIFLYLNQISKIQYIYCIFYIRRVSSTEKLNAADVYLQCLTPQTSVFPHNFTLIHEAMGADLVSYISKISYLVETFRPLSSFSVILGMRCRHKYLKI